MDFVLNLSHELARCVLLGREGGGKKKKVNVEARIQHEKSINLAEIKQGEEIILGNLQQRSQKETMKTAQKFARLTPNTFLQHFIHYDNTVSSIIVIRFCAAVYSLEYIFPETLQKR